MTLCVAWKHDKNIFLASNSCVTIGDSHMKYGGVKVLEIPVRIRSATDQEKKSRELFCKTYGFAFAGSFLNAYFLKEILAESLKNLQTAKNETISFSRIAKFVFYLYSYFFKKLQSQLNGQDIDFIMTGYCPLGNKYAACKFYINIDSEDLSYEEILIEEKFSWVSIGSGEDQFDRKMNVFNQDNLNKNPCMPLYILREIIHNDTLPGVSGTIQLGEYKSDNNFCLISVQDWNDETNQTALFIRGTDINAMTLNEFYVSYEYITPFDEEIKKKHQGRH